MTTLDPHSARTLQHIAAMGGHVSTGYFGDGMDRERDTLESADLIRVSRGGHELTDAGWAWCRENGADS